MLEKQRKWCGEKLEKGKKWIDDHRFEIGIIAGSIATAGLSMITRKILEPKEMILQTATNFDIEDPNFMIRVGGTNVFGRETYHSPWVLYEDGEKDKDRIDAAIMSAINREVEGKEF